MLTGTNQIETSGGVGSVSLLSQRVGPRFGTEGHTATIA
jgi:hypothetical protein